MHLNRIKNIIITFLICTAIYQTCNIWFDNFSIDRVLYILREKSNGNAFKKNSIYALESISINSGENEFINQYTKFTTSEYKKSFDEAIYSCITAGKGSYQDNFDTSYIFENKSVIYNYSKKLMQSDINTIFNVRLPSITKSNTFDKVALVADLDSPQSVSTILYNVDSNNAYVFKLEKQSLAKSVYSIISNFSNIKNKNFYYVMEKQYKDQLYIGNTLIPKAKDGILNKNYILSTNPLLQAGGILLSGLESYINIYFDNPTNKWNSSNSNVYLFNDENVVVKYYNTGVLEYFNYKASKENEDNLDSYKIATEFLEKDINIQNEYYLKDYSKTDKGTTFYFNYKLNNLLIELSDSLKQETEMNSMIEVTVSENRVYKYRKLIYNFSISDKVDSFKVNFHSILQILNQENKNKIVSSNKLNNVDLVYKFDKINEPIGLAWKVTMKNKNRLIDLEYGE